MRGLVYREDGRFIEAPYKIATYLDGPGAQVGGGMGGMGGMDF